MSYTIDYLEDEGIVLVTNTGELTHELFIKQSREALEIGRTNNCKLFLVDCTLMTTRTQTMQIFDAPKVYETIGGSRSNKVALILPADKDTQADLRFYEAVCVNRGWRVKVFAQKGSAIKWLRE